MTTLLNTNSLNFAFEVEYGQKYGKDRQSKLMIKIPKEISEIFKELINKKWKKYRLNFYCQGIYNITVFYITHKGQNYKNVKDNEIADCLNELAALLNKYEDEFFLLTEIIY